MRDPLRMQSGAFCEIPFSDRCSLGSAASIGESTGTSGLPVPVWESAL